MIAFRGQKITGESARQWINERACATSYSFAADIKNYATPRRHGCKKSCVLSFLPREHSVCYYIVSVRLSVRHKSEISQNGKRKIMQTQCRTITQGLV